MTNKNERICKCGHVIKVNEGIGCGLMESPKFEYDLYLFNCPKCNSTLSERVEKNKNQEQK